MCAYTCVFSRTHARRHRSTSDHVSLWRLLQPLIPVTPKLWLRKLPSPALPHPAKGLLLPPKASWDPPFGEYRSGLPPEALPPQGRPPRGLGVGLLWGSGLQHPILPRVRLQALPAAWACGLAWPHFFLGVAGPQVSLSACLWVTLRPKVELFRGAVLGVGMKMISPTPSEFCPRNPPSH